MPAKPRFSREAIIQAALDIVREGGMEALNARSLAHRAGCSTQPLYSAAGGMKAIRQEVYLAAVALYTRHISSCHIPDMPPYKASGLATLRFASQEKNLYKLLFLRDRAAEADPAAADAAFDSTTDAVIDGVMRSTGYTREVAQAFHMRMFVFIQGIAAMLATGYTPYDEAFCSTLLTDEYRAMRLLFDSAGAP